MIRVFKKLNPLGIVCAVVSILLIITLIFTSVTYAYWQRKYEQTDNNIVRTGCFSFSFEDSDSINLSKTYPISENEAMNQVPYTFTIKNICSIDMYYNVTLNTTKNADLDNSIDYKLVDESGNELNKNLLGSLPQYEDYNGKEYNDEAGTYNILTSYILTTGKLSAAIMNDDNSEIILPGESKTYKLYLWVDENVSNDSTMGKTFEGKIIITSTTATKTALYKCKRAKRLHEEKCQSDDDTGCKASGMSYDDDITYGNTLTTLNELKTGDAFDCDVNGDGKYDSINERFYYVSDKYTKTEDGKDMFDSKYAVLIYSSSTYNEDVNNKKYTKYSISDNSWLSGPDAAKTHLPSANKWSNMRLSSTTREIVDEKSEIKLDEFSYAKYVTRLLMYQEVKNGCLDEFVSATSESVLETKCKYLLENTKYQNSALLEGYWLENVNSTESAWAVGGTSKNLKINLVNVNYNGSRPAIEVLKSDIDY